MAKLDLGWLRILVEVGQAGSLSAAAARLGVSQPAVSYQIRKVEDQVGAPLFTRTARGVEMTAAGRVLFDIALRTTHDVDEAQTRLRRERRRIVRLFTDYAFASLWLIPRMEAIRQAFADVDLQVVATQRARHDQLMPGDLAVVFESRDQVVPNAVLLLEEAVVPLRSPRASGAAGAVSGDLAGARLIHLDSQRGAPWHDWQSYFDATGQPMPQGGDMRFNTYSHVIEAALTGQGVALGWLGLVDDLVTDGALVPVGRVLRQAERGYWLIRPPQTDPDPLADWLIQACTSQRADAASR